MRPNPPNLGARPFLAHEAPILRSVGIELALEGRLQQAVALLRQALGFYQQELAPGGVGYLGQQGSIIEAFEVLLWLIRCELGLGDSQKVAGYLTRALELRRSLEAAPAGSEKFTRGIDEVLGHLDFQGGLLAQMRSALSRYRQQSQQAALRCGPALSHMEEHFAHVLEHLAGTASELTCLKLEAPRVERSAAHRLFSLASRLAALKAWLALEAESLMGLGQELFEAHPLLLRHERELLANFQLGHGVELTMVDPERIQRQEDALALALSRPPP